VGLQTFGRLTTQGRMYDLFDYGTLIMLNIVAIAQVKVVQVAHRRSRGLVLLCLGGWLSCFLVFLLEMNFASLRNYNTMRRIFTDANSYLLTTLVLGICFTVDSLLPGK